MALQNLKSGEDLHFDLQNANNESDDDAPPASTIYDPSVLALSPELRAKVAAREARNQIAENQSAGKEENGKENSPFHVFSPVAAKAKKPFEMGVDGKTIRASGGGLEEAREDELELCCFGYIPLYPSLLCINVLNFVSYSTQNVLPRNYQREVPNV